MKNSSIAKRVNARKEHFSDSNHLAILYGYLKGVKPLPIPTMEWYWSGNDVILVNPIDNNMHCIAVMFPQEEFQKAKVDIERFFFSKLEKTENLKSKINQQGNVTAY